MSMTIEGELTLGLVLGDFSAANIRIASLFP
jgi:hypothetical protein